MEQLIINRLGKGKQYLYCICAILIVAAGCFGLSGLIGYRTAAFILLVTVSLLAITFDILPVLVSAALSAFIWNFFFIPPRFTFHVYSEEDTILFFMYFIIALVNGVLTYKIRQAEKISRLKEERANSVKLYNTVLDSLSHELRTPIAAIIGASDNLQMNEHLSGENKEQLISEISRAALRLNQQVENLLNISRLESGHIKPKSDWCDVVELIYDVVKRVEETNPKRKIGISIDPELPLCNLDKGLLDQVLYNLLNNAAIHTGQTCRIEISAACHADRLEVVIEDNGKGFTDINIKEVFHKFSRVKNPLTSGSGLGLSIVKGFTEAMGGDVQAQHVQGGGARFIITLPVKTMYPKLSHA